ncbi:glycosyltransferase family 2 protein [Nannocystis sp. SCPEA4]|uniref:glycosyltransferase family 2 protein n=1 Tax=Nannocystis sp. SCPEA4 TaxID=2996787 RepID=UPI00226EF36F|nr:glycosyltransferase family 2 protein [Nannocystis sp. SCPEA4]MCY1061969.1 glycosyltransferase family 2 protein [Nannocystis sp. SCPEA4]
MAPPTPADVTIVVPCYNEGPVIGEVLAELRRAWPHVIAVDDGSGDDTYARLQSTGATVVRHAVNLGQGAALQTGIELALHRGARFVVTFDGDGQHRAEDVAALVAPLAEGRADVALGSRFLGGTEGMPSGRRVVLRLATAFTRVAAGLDLTDTHNGLRAFTAEAARKLRITQNRMAHASEILHEIRRLRLRFVEVPVTIRYTERSRRKGQSALDALSILFDLLVRRLMG